MRYIMQPNASASAARGFLRVGCTRLLGPAWGRATGPALWSHCPRFLDAPIILRPRLSHHHTVLLSAQSNPGIISRNKARSAVSISQAI
jgi:hypothetical protein